MTTIIGGTLETVVPRGKTRAFVYAHLDEIRQLANQGSTLKQIALHFGLLVGVPKVSECLKDAGLVLDSAERRIRRYYARHGLGEPPPELWDIDWMRREYACAGQSVKYLAQRLQMNKIFIAEYLKYLQLN